MRKIRKKLLFLRFFDPKLAYLGMKIARLAFGLSRLEPHNADG